jgi:hypothetical protein
MWFYAVADMEVIHGVQLTALTSFRHDDFDNMRKIPFNEFIEWHPPALPAA